MQINWRPSPHHSPRTKAISAIVLHSDASKSAAATIGWLQQPESKVSYHYLVGRTGSIYQFVRDADEAWHAGVSVLDGEANCNDFSLGLAFSNENNGEPYTPAALAVMAELCGVLMEKYGIPRSRVTTHALVAPGRKTDPCPPFDLAAFRAALPENT